MITFLKRRWLLLAAALVLLTCTFTDWCIRVWSGETAFFYLRTEDGLLGLVGSSTALFDDEELPLLEFHAPKVGAIPEFRWDDSFKWIVVPLWFPLCAVIGWGAFRELRRAEKGTGDGAPA